LNSEGLTDIAVEILRGTILQFSYEDRNLEEQDFSVPARFGGSLGPHGSTESSSTLGGFLNLEFADGAVRKFGVTNYHCVDPKMENLEWAQDALFPGDPNNHLELSQPSLSDYNRALDKYREEIRAVKSSVNASIIARVEQNDPSASKRDRRLYDGQQAEIRRLEGLITKAEDFYRVGGLQLGKVFAGSGLRVNQSQRILDWALVDIRSDRINDNYILQLEDVSVKLRNIYAPDKVVSEVIEPEADMPVFKLGKRTGFTHGLMNGTRPTDIQSWHQTRDGSWTKIRGYAWEVVPVNPDAFFGRPGDSGSFVLDNLGQFVGLYLGGDFKRGTGLFMEAKDLFADIKYVTGAAKVTVPQL
jgi:hypothetical protein